MVTVTVVETVDGVVVNTSTYKTQVKKEVVVPNVQFGDKRGKRNKDRKDP